MTHAGPAEPPNAVAPSGTSLAELAVLFARLGATAFGGPVAPIAMMQDELVNRRKWLTEERFLDLLGATNLLPGPNAAEMAIHVGWDRRRCAGLVVAGVSFVVPATVITGFAVWAYVRFGAVPETGRLLYGVKPVILGVVVQALWVLAPKAAQTTVLRVLAVVAVLLVALGVHELVVLFGAGASAFVLARASLRRSGGAANLLLPLAPTVAVGAVHAVTLPALFWVFLKTGTVLFGSGYVVFAFLRADLVDRLGWLTEAQLLDAIVVGQITPGPVFNTATFVGYVLAGMSGALVATLGILLPAFVLVGLSGPIVPRLRASPGAAAFLDGVNVASLALMAVVTAQFGRAALTDIPTVCLAVLSVILFIGFKLSTTWVLLGGAAAGWALHALR